MSASGKDAQFRPERTLSGLLNHVWGELMRAVEDSSHSFRYPVFVTGQSGDGLYARTVVLRTANREQRRLSFYTDTRSPKVEQIREESAVNWVFYDADSHLQVRVAAEATVAGPSTSQRRSAWQGLSQRARLNYSLQHPPGTFIPTPGDAYAGETEAGRRDAGFENFTIVETVVHTLDCLQLYHDQHERALYEWCGNNWKKRWITP